MGIFKKKGKITPVEQRCTVDGCRFTTMDSGNMQKHIEWKHSGSKPNHN